MSVRPEVLRLHCDGLTSTDIALHVKRSRQRVEQILKADGLSPNRRVKPSDEQIAALFWDGLTTHDVAQRLGVSVDYAAAARRRAGAPYKRGNPPALAPEQVGRLLDLARQGNRQVDIAKEFGVSQCTVSTIMRANGIERQPARHSRERL